MNTGGKSLSADEAVSIAKKAIKLRDSGMKAEEVAKALGRNWHTIRKYLRLYKIAGEQSIIDYVKAVQIAQQAPKKTMGSNPTAKQVKLVVKKAIELRRQRMVLEDIAPVVGCCREILSKYLNLYRDGGYEAIDRVYGKPKNGKSKPNTRESIWSPEFKHSDLWNVALFGKESLSL